MWRWWSTWRPRPACAIPSTNPHAYVEANLVGFVNLLECCRHHQVKHLVFASSSSVYGANTKMPFSVHHNVDHPVSLYAATKKSNELMAHTYSHLYDLACTGCAFSPSTAPGAAPTWPFSCSHRAIFEDKPIQVFNHGRMQRDFTYIDDIVEGVVRVMQADALPTPAGAAMPPILPHPTHPTGSTTSATTSRWS
jgi:UDP-glucuronate 4-epimerase